MVMTALLIAFGIVIPTAFGFLRVILPPAFTATLTAHVPIFIAMFISPASAVFTAIGTTVGFWLSGLDAVVVMRAGSQIIFAVIGSYMIKKKMSVVLTGVVTGLLHAFFEALTVYLFLSLGLTAAKEGVSYLTASFFVVGIGTLIHHTIDYIIAVIIVKALSKMGTIKKMPSML